MTESAKRVWRKGFGMILPVAGLEALRAALKSNDPDLIQGNTVQPRNTQRANDWPVCGACPVGYCGWRGESKNTIGDVEEFFALMCSSVDSELGEPAACRYFLNWVDETPREDMVRELLAEVELSLSQRREQPAPAVAVA